jgi:hypothetical protein
VAKLVTEMRVEGRRIYPKLRRKRRGKKKEKEAETSGFQTENDKLTDEPRDEWGIYKECDELSTAEKQQEV